MSVLPARGSAVAAPIAIVHSYTEHTRVVAATDFPLDASSDTVAVFAKVRGPHSRLEAGMSSNVSPLGLKLFALYLAAYGTFVGLNAFWPDVMKKPVIAGVNLAIVYGFGLIVGAFVLALIYAVASGDEGQT
jgi:adenosylcobinamide amidohydrolase